MIRGIYTAAAGMIVQMDRQDVISNNLANVDNTGFKKDQAVIKEYPGFELYRKDDEREIIPGGIESKLTPVGKLGTGAQLQDVATDFTQGAILETGNKTDFAILGDGFFAVDTANGVKLTRDGSFYIDKNKYLVDGNGNKVLALSADNKPSYILADADFQISNGIIKGATLENVTKNLQGLNINGGNANEALAFVNVQDKNSLVKEGKNYYSLPNQTSLTKGGEYVQGSLEKSNVSVVKEMVEMISCSRAYETNQKALTSQDEALNKVVSEVGKWA